MVRVADYVASFLYEHGIRDVFMLAGGGSIYLDDGIANSQINPICVCNEATAPMMAEAYARANGNLGAAIVTTGPGGANAVAGIVEAWVDSAPIIVISGQVESQYTSRGSGERTLGTQELDIVSVVDSITKHSAVVDNSHDIRYHLEKAIHVAKLGRKGPVWLDIPLDVQNAEVSGKLRGYASGIPNCDFDNRDIEEIYILIEKAERPIFVVGQGVRQAGAIDDFMALAEETNIPVIVSRLGQDILPHSHPLYFGHAGMRGNKYANVILKEADLIVSLGSRLALPFANGNIHGKLVMVDIDRGELEKQHVDLPIRADVGLVIEGLLLYSDNMGKDKWLERCKQLKTENPTIIPDTDPTDLYYLMSELDKNALPNTIFVNDAGSSNYVAGQVLNFEKGQREITSGAFASMGVALPLAIGASVADRTRPVVAVIGDGSMELNIQELKTLVQVGTNVKIFIVNNGGYVSIRNTQNSFGGKHIGSEVGNVMNFKKIADAFGILYRRLEHADDLVAISALLNFNGQLIVEVMCDTEQKIQ